MFPRKTASELFWVPLPIGLKKQITFATKWLISILKIKYKRVRLDHIVDILIKSIYNEGDLILKKKQVYLDAKQNNYMIRYFK